jgi:two-component system chemotaxis response regulator CheY
MAIDTSIMVLVVNEAQQMRRIIKESLKQLGFKYIIEAENGKEGFDKLKKEKVGLIISDCNLPNMTGLELLKAVRDDVFLKTIPFLIITADGRKSNVIEAQKAGVSNYIVTPFTHDTFTNKIQAIL